MEEIFTDPDGNLRVRYRARSKAKLDEIINKIRWWTHESLYAEYISLEDARDIVKELEEFRDREL